MISLGGFLLGFLVYNNVFTFLWSLFSRPIGGYLDENEPLSWKVKGSQAENAYYCLAIMMGDLGYEQLDKQQETTTYTPKTYKLSKYDDVWDEKTKGMILPEFIGEHIVTGEPFWNCAYKQLHVCEGGTSGTGKSTDVRTHLECMARNAQKQPLEIVAIDGKQTELHPFEHEKRVKITVHYENDQDQFFKEIERLHALMFERMKALRIAKCVDILEYNAQYDEPMNFIILLIDEFGRLFKTSNSKDDKVYNARIAKYLADLIELGRACGFILRATTQNPSIRSIPASVFAQFGTTKCFRLKRKIDSERVLSDRIDGKWAHQLKGKGVFLYQSANLSFCGLAPHTELSDFPWYAEYKGLSASKSKYTQQKEQANTYIHSLLKKNNEVTVSVEDLAQHLSVINDKKFKDSILGPVLAEFPKKQPIKKGKKIFAYKIFKSSNNNNHDKNSQNSIQS